MTACELLRERMPEVARGSESWPATDLAHLSECASCALEWQIVQAGTRLGARTIVDADRIALAVLSRLRAPVDESPAIRRIPWRGGIIGLMAAAASVVLILSAPRLHRPGVVGISDTAALAVLPELQVLDEGQLENVLQSLGPSAGDATPGVLPHLEDLTDSELEQLLHSGGGE